MISLKSRIVRFIFYNENSGFAIVKLEDNTTATGVLPKLQKDDIIEFWGEWVEHPKYGKQFKFESYKIEYPTTVNDILKFLSSGAIKGIGEKIAQKIIDKFGEKTFYILDNDVDELGKVKGVGKIKAGLIQLNWKEKKKFIELSLFFQTHGISSSYAIKIQKNFGDDSLNIIKNNPFILVNGVWGIGFKQADEIALKLGMGEHSHQRLKSAVIYILNDAAASGHVFISFSDLNAECMDLLKYELAVRDKILLELETENEIVITGERIYLSSLYFSERGIENNIRRLNQIETSSGNSIKNIVKKLHANYSDEQIEAIKKSLEHKVFVLTGGPGTGKTETLKGIITVYEEEGKKILLAAPTGRAAKRMTEVIGKEAKTIHRLLEYNPMQHVFNRNGENRLKADLIVIDEVSMIDTVLMFNLLEAVDDNTSLILVGDANQLPSIGPGNILKDLIESDILAITTLTKIFRQARESEIIIAAHRILKGEISFFAPGIKNDFIFIEENDESKIGGHILQLCKETLPAKYGLDPYNDIQVLSPMNKGTNGTKSLNNILQDGLNGNKSLLKHGHFDYKPGDKVMQVINNYDKDVFNGDWGIIKPEVKNKTYFINFNNKTIAYKEEDFDELTLAYAITVHKSQGSEYPCVILPLVNSHYIMLQRNLLYTAVTRAKSLMIIIGSKKAFTTAVNNNRITGRNTSLFKDVHENRKYIPFDF